MTLYASPTRDDRRWRRTLGAAQPTDSPCKEFAVEAGRLGFGADTEAVVEELDEVVVAGADGFLEAELGFGLERDRWAGTHQRLAFEESVTALRTAAMIAGLDDVLVERYVFLAHVARRASEIQLDIGSGEPDDMSIPSEIAATTVQAARLVVEGLWHPYLARLRRGRRRAELEQAVAAARRADDGRDPRVRWNLQVGP